MGDRPRGKPVFYFCPGAPSCELALVLSYDARVHGKSTFHQSSAGRIRLQRQGSSNHARAMRHDSCPKTLAFLPGLGQADAIIFDGQREQAATLRQVDPDAPRFAMTDSVDDRLLGNAIDER